MTTKVQELGIFATGIGVLLAALTLWLNYAVQPDPGRERSLGVIAIALGFGAVYVVLGVLTLLLKSRVIIQLTISIVVLGLLLDLLIGFNVIKAIISGLVICLVIKTGRQALVKAKPATVRIIACLA